MERFRALKVQVGWDTRTEGKGTTTLLFLHPAMSDGTDKRCAWRGAVPLSRVNDAGAEVPKCGPSLYLFHSAEGRVPSMKMGLNVRYSVTFWKAGWNTQMERLWGLPALSPLLSQKNMPYSLHDLLEPKYLSMGWVVAAILHFCLWILLFSEFYFLTCLKYTLCSPCLLKLRCHPFPCSAVTVQPIPPQAGHRKFQMTFFSQMYKTINILYLCQKRMEGMWKVFLKNAEKATLLSQWREKFPSGWIST